MSKKPLLSARAKEMSGLNQDGLARLRQQQRDITFIKGYSDVRAEIEESIRRRETPARQLKHRFQWIPTTAPNTGRPAMYKVSVYAGLGYKAMKFEEMAGMGYEVPVHAFKTPDGGVQVGDVQLFYCDADTAEQHWQDGRQAIDEQTTDEATSQSLHQAGQGLEGVTDRAGLTSSETKHRTEVSRP